MGSSNNLAPAMLALTEQQRNFISTAIRTGDYTRAKTDAGYAESVHYSWLLRDPRIAAAFRGEVARQLATDGAQIGFHTLKRVARDEKAPAAAQVAAAKALLQGAGLLDQPQQGKESKSINDMTRDELRGYIESKKAEIDGMERKLADGAIDVTPIAQPQTLDPLG
jgi:phage terminase small subunit